MFDLTCDVTGDTEVTFLLHVIGLIQDYLVPVEFSFRPLGSRQHGGHYAPPPPPPAKGAGRTGPAGRGKG